MITIIIIIIIIITIVIDNNISLEKSIDNED